MKMKRLKRIRVWLQEKTRAAAAPRNPKNGAVSSPLNVDISDCGSETTSLGSARSLSLSLSLSLCGIICLKDQRSGGRLQAFNNMHTRLLGLKWAYWAWSIVNATSLYDIAEFVGQNSPFLKNILIIAYFLNCCPIMPHRMFNQ